MAREIALGEDSWIIWYTTDKKNVPTITSMGGDGITISCSSDFLTVFQNYEDFSTQCTTDKISPIPTNNLDGDWPPDEV